jgi:hypothetical protein
MASKKKMITAKQKSARRKNMAVARRARKKGGGGHASTPASTLGKASRQNKKLKAALRQKTIRSTNKVTTSKGRRRMKKRISANIAKYGGFKLASHGGKTVSGKIK